ncbi:hypothetical protein DJ73_17435 [Halorubrum sp. Ea1]|uniref:DUF7282 domain-containing protein n=1 Tax=Halorubrum sp. Ea1 TaxID=1480718 RepID=UPI000B993D98|nr:hypothetical protein [Halorubrum sp. Ea1]OYR49686.1 hypothetical protein DJ73_17435 [Halorubrum sp. Ea1]
MEAPTRKLLAVLLAAVMLSSVVGMVGAQELRPQVASPMNADATVTFSDQPTDSTSVTVDSVNMSDGGFVVIHDDSLLEGDVTGSVIGVSEYLEPGETENVSVTLFDGVPGATFNQTALTDNQTLIAMPHRDRNANETYDFVATNGSADGPYLANETAVTDAANVTVESTQTTGESFAVADLTAPTVIEQGDTLEVTATIENPNDAADTQTVEYRFNGNVTFREEVRLEAGETTMINASVNTSELVSDTYIHGVYTQADGQPAQVQVVDEIASFRVTGLSAPASVTTDDTVTVEATIQNPNTFGIDQPVEFRFDGDLVETQNVDLDAESSTTVQFEINTEGTTPGTYIHSIFSNDFGQDAIITVEAPDDAPPTDGEDDGDGDDGDDAEDGEDAEDGNDAENGDDTEDGDDSAGENGDEADDGDESDDGTDSDDGADEDTSETDDGTDGDDGADGDDATDGDDEANGENTENGDDSDSSDDGTDDGNDDGTTSEDGDDQQSDSPEDG